MFILRTRNKITDFLMILAWASPFNIIYIAADPGHDTLRPTLISIVQISFKKLEERLFSSKIYRPWYIINQGTHDNTLISIIGTSL